jgi:hypothetical protein
MAEITPKPGVKVQIKAIPNVQKRTNVRFFASHDQTVAV